MLATDSIDTSRPHDEIQDTSDPVLGWFFRCRSRYSKDGSENERKTILTRYSGGPVFHCDQNGRIINNPIWLLPDK